jgi:vanillate O-demethylase monooxygenase subunit
VLEFDPGATPHEGPRMPWLRNSWYQAAWSTEVTREAPLTRTLLNEPLLLYRTQDGAVAALFDRCPHRFAPLSNGRVEGDSAICGYHGLGFGPGGACTRNPHGAITPAMRVRSYPVEERHSAIWVWTGESDRADPALIPDLGFIDETPETARVTGHLRIAANYQLMSDNILDITHADYLHPTRIGGAYAGARLTIGKRPGGKIYVEWFAEDCEPPPTFKVSVPEGRADLWFDVLWQAPAVMVNMSAAVPTGGGKTPIDETYTLHNMVPETETSSHYFYCATRRFDVDNVAFSDLVRETTSYVFRHEDQPTLEGQQGRMGNDDFWSLDPILLPTDAAAVQARRQLEKLIAAEDRPPKSL